MKHGNRIEYLGSVVCKSVSLVQVALTAWSSSFRPVQSSYGNQKSPSKFLPRFGSTLENEKVLLSFDRRIGMQGLLILRKIWLNLILPALREVRNKISPPIYDISVGFNHNSAEWHSSAATFVEDSSSYLVELNDPCIPGLRTRHLFDYRRVWMVKDAVFSAKSGVLRLERISIRESYENAPARRPERFFFSSGRPSDGLLIGIASKNDNYYHWLLEDLPAVLRAYSVHQEARALLPDGQPRFVQDSLGAYRVPCVAGARGATKSDFVFAEKGDNSGWPHREDIQHLRGVLPLAMEGNIQRQRKVYVSRRFSRRSPLLEEDLEDFLKSIGFEVVFLERLTFIEQVEIFSQANLVVGVHGAGLANAVFMPEGSELVELAPLDRAIQCFEVIGQTLGIGYRRLLLEKDLSRRDRVGENVFRILSQFK